MSGAQTNSRKAVAKEPQVYETHQSLEKMLGQQMERVYYQASEGKTDRGHVKSYLIESHLGKTGVVEQLTKLVAKNEVLLQKTEFEFQQLTDPTLFLIRASHDDAKRAEIYVDCRQNRFWKCHSVSYSASVDPGIEKLVKLTPKLDRVWLSQDFLLNIKEWDKSSFRGFKVEHQKITPKHSKAAAAESPDQKPPGLKLDSRSSVHENLSSRLLSVMQADEVLKAYSNVSGLKVKFGDPGEYNHETQEYEQGDFAIEDIKDDGKFRARGTDYDHHEKMMSSCLRLYLGALKKVESCWIGGRGTGHPFIFKLSDEGAIRNVEEFCHFVFSAEDVFSLVGFPQKIGPDAFRVVATDLHSAGRIQMDVFPTFLKFYLFKGTCGNSLLRFYANLQKYHDAQVLLRNHQGKAFQLLG